MKNDDFIHEILTAMHLSRLLVALVVLTVFWLPVCAAEQGTINQGTVYIESALRSQPSFSGKTIMQLQVDTRVTVLEERGIWLKVSLADKTEAQGWLRRFDIRLDSMETKSTGSSGLGRLLGGLIGGDRRPLRTEPAGVTPTLGIRGLDAVDLQNASPDPAQLKLLDDFRSNAARAEKLAGDAGLQAREVEFLKQPEPAADDDDSEYDSW